MSELTRMFDDGKSCEIFVTFTSSFWVLLIAVARITAQYTGPAKK